MKDQVEGGAAVLTELLKQLGYFGTAWVLWTVLVACALLNGDSDLVKWLWPTLFWTWITLGGAYFVGSTLLLRKTVPKLLRDALQEPVADVPAHLCLTCKRQPVDPADVGDPERTCRDCRSLG